MIMPQLIINTCVSLMYELKKKTGKVLTSKSVGTGSSSYEKRIYRAAVSQRLRNTVITHMLYAHRIHVARICWSNTWRRCYLQSQHF